MLSTRTAVGSIGMLANHEPVLAMLEPTELRLYRSDSEIVRFAQAEGYLQFAENRALVLVEEAIAPEAIDRETFQTRLKEAQRGGRGGAGGHRAPGPRAARHPPLRGLPRRRAVGSTSARQRPPGRQRCRGALRAQAARLVHDTRLQRLLVRPDAARLQRAAARACSRSAGASSGEPRRTPVNLLTVDGTRYLVAPRGETQWVRNLRAAGEGQLLLGRRSEPFTAIELADEREGADPARLPEALEGRGRRVLRRGRARLLGVRDAARSRRSTRFSGSAPESRPSAGRDLAANSGGDRDRLQARHIVARAQRLAFCA